MTSLAPTLQSFFTEHLARERNASAHTTAAYRDTWKLLLTFAAGYTGIPVSRIEIGQLDAPLIARFLDHLEHERGNSIRTRNARLAAIHSLFHYAALRHPEHAADIQRVLAIPAKRYERTIIDFLTELEAEALLAAPDRTTRIGRRDYALIELALATGLRASEMTGLIRADVYLGAGAHVSCHGKGRKERITPIDRATVATLRAHFTENPASGGGPLFTTNRGTALTRDGLAQRLALHARTATAHCPSLIGKKVTPHILRHTTAMRLLHAGVETTVIALWLGHESPETTQIYLTADLELKERALARTAPGHLPPGRYQPPDTILAFLEGL